ncbi:methylated-DNA--[protein]-cysteine S-methyltransferase [Paenibacillus sp. 1011MAR3C5]|uniref:methylated-DNA--[protein]-cysteine S-methyltransferase n=1 Tax=Paenibacillus sp. 1011MAR3C5 TaxID=1675787 RepID=UPI000E6C01A3|nr:methylated-DNA--[protein]-cysteine S-methyltransferase [Paenibacillus sp. 1011MAR3C5]RJE86881.1 methylated-DNA--[protein]-cysteine S-methyltransferase [Paenibacillus sp. 1011MAR3C5]
MTMYKLDIATPIGVLEIIGTHHAIVSILFVERETPAYPCLSDTPDALQQCARELNEYFNGDRSAFTFPYSCEGTAFQSQVWNALKSVPFAQTGTYQSLAQAIGNEKAVRAVGSANGRNKLSIVIPCHRIIGSNGTLTGYAGGLWRKEWLLQHEQSVAQNRANQDSSKPG